MAGRSLTHLKELRNLTGAPAATPLVTAKPADPARLRALFARPTLLHPPARPSPPYLTTLVARRRR